MLRSTLFALLALPALVQAQALPPELDCIPRDATGFVSIRGDLLKNETLKPVRDFIVKHNPTLLKKLESRAGFHLDEISRVTLLFPSIEGLAPPLIFVTLNKPYDKARLLTKVKASSNRMWMAMPPPPMMSRPSSRPDYPRSVPSFPKSAPDAKPRANPKIEPEPPERPMAPPPQAKDFAQPSAPKEFDEPAHEIVIDPEQRMFEQFSPGKPDLGAAYYYLGPTGNMLVCFDERTLLFVPDADREGGRSMLNLLPSLFRPVKKEALDDALSQAEKHALVVGVKVAGIPKSLHFPEPVSTLLTSAESLTLTADLTTELAISLRVGFADSAAALEGRKKVVGVMKHLKEEAPSLRKSLAKSSSGKILAEFMDQWETLLAKPTYSQKEAVIEVSSSVKIDGVLTKALEKALAEVNVSEQHARSQNNLKQIGLAIHNYHDSYRQFPFPGVNGRGPLQPNMKPNLSWRVAILPFLGENQLYRQFKFDEPWDSEHNKTLISLMPKVYAPVNRIKAPKGQTFYQIFQGASAIRPGMRMLDFTDGLSNTILVVESDDSVPWTQPEDLLYNPKKPLPKLGGLFGGDFNALMGDGSVKWIPKAISEEKLRALITPDNGETIADE